MKKFILLILLLPAMGLQALAAGKSGETQSVRHEFRLGAGDMLFETLIWHDQLHKKYTGAKPDFLFPEDRAYGYSPHMSVEYAYHILPWMSIGTIVDFQVTGWSREWYNSSNKLASTTYENFYNLCIMPTARFNYFRREHVGLYSSISVGMDVNGGSEYNGFGKNTELGLAADIRFIGVTVGGGHWWGFAELGGLYALRNKNAMYMMSSQIVKVGASYKF